MVCVYHEGGLDARLLLLPRRTAHCACSAPCFGVYTVSHLEYVHKAAADVHLDYRTTRFHRVRSGCIRESRQNPLQLRRLGAQADLDKRTYSAQRKSRRDW
jgi:hypothetical protein